MLLMASPYKHFYAVIIPMGNFKMEQNVEIAAPRLKIVTVQISETFCFLDMSKSACPPARPANSLN